MQCALGGIAKLGAIVPRTGIDEIVITCNLDALKFEHLSRLAKEFGLRLSIRNTTYQIIEDASARPERTAATATG
jgi:hypothetical protein